MAKKELTLTEFRALIREEAEKFKKRVVLENEKKALQAELKELMGESYMEEYGSMMEDEMEEGLFSKADTKAHDQELNFLASAPEAEQVRALYQKYVQSKDKNALAQANRILVNYATQKLKMEKGSASSFVNGVYRALQGDLSRRVSQKGGTSGGLGI
jgi:molybdopterin converting factor small subunit